MLDEFLAFFSSLTKSMDMLQVIKGLKPVSRIIVPEDEVESTREFLEDRGLALAFSDNKISKSIDVNRYSNKGVILNADSKDKGDFFVYISKDLELAKQAKKHESELNHKELGRLLGYPECCCRFFEGNFQVESKKNNDYVLPALKNSDGFEFPFYTNIAIRHMDISLLSHFPCNFNCQASIEIAKNNLKLLEELSPELGQIAQGMLKGVVIYTTSKGIFLLRNPKIDKNKISYEGVMSSVNNQLYEYLKKSKSIKIVGKNCIKAGRIEIKGEDVGIMVFD